MSKMSNVYVVIRSDKYITVFSCTNGHVLMQLHTEKNNTKDCIQSKSWLLVNSGRHEAVFPWKNIMYL